MFNAKEAREKSIEARRTAAFKIVMITEQAIKSATEEGRFEITLRNPRKILPLFMAHFKNLGYQVDVSDGGEHLTVRW